MVKLPGISIENRAMKYGYANARVKGMKGLLLNPAFLEELINVRTIDAMVELLQRTHYKEELVKLSLNYSGSALVEIGTAMQFTKIVKKVRILAPKDETAVIDGLLRRWDLLNLKTIINARRSGKKFDSIKPYIFEVGSITKEELEKIASADENEVFMEIKKTDFGREMFSQSTAFFTTPAWNAFNAAVRNADNFLQIQTILDSYFYLLMDKVLNYKNNDVQLIRKIIKKEIDAKNILIISRLKLANFPKEKIKQYLIHGGTLKEYAINQIIEARDLIVIASIIKSKFHNIDIKENPSLVELEILLEKAIAAEKVAAFHRSILSIGVLIGFLLLKEEELNNLRKIAKAKEYGISENEVKQMLVVV